MPSRAYEMRAYALQQNVRPWRRPNEKRLSIQAGHVVRVDAIAQRNAERRQCPCEPEIPGRRSPSHPDCCCCLTLIDALPAVDRPATHPKLRLRNAALQIIPQQHPRHPSVDRPPPSPLASPTARDGSQPPPIRQVCSFKLPRMETLRLPATPGRRRLQATKEAAALNWFLVFGCRISVLSGLAPSPDPVQG